MLLHRKDLTMLKEKITLQSEDITDEMKAQYLKHIVDTNKIDLSFRHVWIESPSCYRNFTEYMYGKGFLKYKDGRAKYGLTISKFGEAWLNGYNM